MKKIPINWAVFFELVLKNFDSIDFSHTFYLNEKYKDLEYAESRITAHRFYKSKQELKDSISTALELLKKDPSADFKMREEFSKLDAHSLKKAMRDLSSPKWAIMNTRYSLLELYSHSSKKGDNETFCNIVDEVVLNKE